MESFSALLGICEGIHRSAGDSPHKRSVPPVTGRFPHNGPVTRALVFSLVYAWTNGLANTWVAGDLRRNGATWRLCNLVIITHESLGHLHIHHPNAAAQNTPTPPTTQTPTPMGTSLTCRGHNYTTRDHNYFYLQDHSYTTRDHNYITSYWTSTQHVIKEFCAGSRYQGKGQVVTSHRYYGI